MTTCGIINGILLIAFYILEKRVINKEIREGVKKAEALKKAFNIPTPGKK